MVSSLVWFGLVMAAVMLATVAAAVFLMPRLPMRYRVERHLVACPADGLLAEVDYVFRSDGGEVTVDVLRCSHRPGERPVACGRECRSLSVAPFTARRAG
jgi:hypothetical protein